MTDSGKLIGLAINPDTGEYHAYLWDGSMHDLGTLGGSSIFPTRATESGHVISRPSGTELTSFFVGLCGTVPDTT